MQSTEQYGTSTTVAGADREAVLAWMRRQAGWERRLRDLESHREPGSAVSPPRLRLVTDGSPPAATDGPDRADTPDPHARDESTVPSTRTARRAG